MSVFRVERTHNYTVMSNYHLRDRNLSLKAKGLLSQILSLPEDWDYSLSGLAYINSEGRDAIRTAVQELERAGYIHRSRVRDDKGCLRGTEYVIYEEPQQPDENETESTAGGATAPIFSSRPALKGPVEVAPVLESPMQGATTQLNIDKTNYLKNKILTSQSKDSLPFPSSPPSSSQSPILAAQLPETKGRKRMSCRSMSEGEMDIYREIIRENIGYDEFVRERPYDAERLDEMVELMVEAVCSTRETLRIAGNDFPQAVVKSRLLKLNEEHIRFVFDCLKENTTQVRNMKQYLLTVLYNAPTTMENHYYAA
jgi:hypothetical protein